MANGFFLGGMADGMNSAAQLGIKKDELAQDLALKTRGLDIQQQGIGLRDRELGQDMSLRTRALNLTEQAQKNTQARDVIGQADKAVSETMSVVSETIAQGLAAGKDPAIIAKAVRPLVESAKSIAAKSGRQPELIESTVNALFARPTGEETAAGAGRAKAASAVAQSKALDAADVVIPDKDKNTAEGALRDDYLKASADFIKIRDAKNRIDVVEDTGAGDIALVFQYMKVLDPGSTVREGEFATASNAAGVPASVIAQYNKIRGGGVLAPQSRNEIKSQAGGLYQAQARQHGKLTDQFKSIAKRQGLNVDNAIVDLDPKAKSFAESYADRVGNFGAGTTPGGLNFKIIKPSTQGQK